GNGGDRHLPTDGSGPTPRPVTITEGRTWGRAVAIGIAAFIVSRLCMLAGAGVRASQLTVDAHDELKPPPGSAWHLVTSVFTQWDGLWYLEIVRHGYPRSIPPDITYFQLEARTAFFPMFPLVVRLFDHLIPGGDTLAVLGLNLVFGVAAMLVVGHLARRLYDNDVAERAMVLFAVFPGSVVLSYAYAEALLILLAALCLWFLLDERWLLAGITPAAGEATEAQRNT